MKMPVKKSSKQSKQPKQDIYELYMKYVKEYTQKLGERTAVFMQVGDFMEMYYFNKETDQRNRKVCEYLADVLNIRISRKSKNDVYMAGFPIHSVEKFYAKVIETNFSVVVIEQTEKDENNKVDRFVSHIASPGTDIIYTDTPKQNWMACFYFTGYESVISHNKGIQVGISLIDTRTGESFFTQYESNPSSSYITYPLDECIRILQHYSPKEVCIINQTTATTNIPELNREKLLDTLGLLQTDDVYVHYNYTLHESDFTKMSVRDHYFKTIFKQDVEWIEEQMNIVNMTDASISLAYLLEFITFQNTVFTEQLEFPKKLDDNNILCLANTAARQLNIIPKEEKQHSSFGRGKTIDSLLSILNNAKTPMGKRALRHRLLNPITSSTRLDKHYDYIDYLRETTRYKQLLPFLASCNVDISKIHRRLLIQKMRNEDFISQTLFYDTILELLDSNTGIIFQNLPQPETIQQFREIVKDIHINFYIDKIPSVSVDVLTQQYIKPTIIPKLDNLFIRFENNQKVIEKIIERFTTILGLQSQTTPAFKRDFEDLHFCLTNARASKFKTNVDTRYKSNQCIKVTVPQKKTNESVETSIVKEFKVSEFTIEKSGSKSEKRVCHPLLTSIFSESTDLIYQIQKIHKDFLTKKLTEYKEYITIFREIEQFVIDLDISVCIADTSLRYGYCRPSFNHSDIKENKSSFYAKGIRHPIIERIIDTEYIKNDVFLNEEQMGIPLFGSNAVGKSSFQKAVGLAIVMAQAGFYVPCDEFTIAPYKKIFARIINDDNLFKGLSTFQKEMTELHAITSQVGPQTIVLGDELCSGTEKNSAVAIFSASIDYILKRGGQFIFATHFHDILSHTEIINNPTIHPYHLSVMYDKEQDKLIYDRKLTPGSGAKSYGIEVCKKCRLPEEIVTMAMEIRGREEKKTMTSSALKQSHFNSKKILGGACEVCKTKPSEEVHHIQFQCNADLNELIGSSVSKDDCSNLVSLCKECHHNVHHSENLVIHGWVMTDQGRELDYKYIQNESPITSPEKPINKNSTRNKKKYSNDVVLRVKELSQIHNVTNIKNLLSKENIAIGPQTIRKMIQGKY